MYNKISFTIAASLMSLAAFSQTWGTYGTGLNAALNGVNSVITNSGNIITTGQFSAAGGNPARNIAQYSGGSWSAVGTGLNSTGYCLCMYGGNLYAGGMYDSAGGVYAVGVAEWNGTSWSQVGTGLGSRTTTLAAGIYFYAIFENNKVVQRNKIVIER